MARSGLSKAQVKSTRDELVAQGRYPSVDAVRLALGNTGSKTTIHRYLKELEDEGSDAGARRDDTAQALQHMVRQLADKLHEDTERRLRALQAEHAATLQHKERELAALREQVAMLRARLEGVGESSNVPAHAPVPEPAASGRKSIRDIGFGIFGNLLSATRGGRGDASTFSNLLNGGRTEIIDPESLSQSGLKFQ